MKPDRSASTVRQGWKRRFSRTGLALAALLSVLALSACYHQAPYREASPAAPEDTVAAQKAPPLTQVYFYPKEGQTEEQQSRDHYECYNWAIKQTGFDPGQSAIPREQRVRVVPMPPMGYDTAALAVAGAVLGALIGGPRHAAEGALIGAAGGAIAGAASDGARVEAARQQEEAYAARNRTYDTQLYEKAAGFRRAMGACLEGRGYTVQ